MMGETFTSEVQVKLLDRMGDDLSVVNSARVSFNKESDTDTWIDFDEGQIYSTNPVLKSGDNKLIKYLSSHGHWTPFAHNALSFRISAPLFVMRQLGKHQVGLVWNEVSRRYVTFLPQFYVPEVWRMKAENVKQGSDDNGLTNAEVEKIICEKYTDGESGCVLHTKEIAESAIQTYETLLDIGICAEQARMVLPQNMMSEFIWTGSLYAFARICKERCAPDCQKETRDVADEIFRVCDGAFPASWYYLMSRTFPDKYYTFLYDEHYQGV